MFPPACLKIDTKREMRMVLQWKGWGRKQLLMTDVLWQYEAVFSPFSQYFMEHNWLRASDATLSEFLLFCTEATLSIECSLLLMSPLSQNSLHSFWTFFVGISNMSAQLSLTLSPRVWLASQSDAFQPAPASSRLAFLRGHFPHTVPAHSFWHSLWKTQTDTKVYAYFAFIYKENTYTNAHHTFHRGQF